MNIRFFSLATFLGVFIFQAFAMDNNQSAARREEELRFQVDFILDLQRQFGRRPEQPPGDPAPAARDEVGAREAGE